MYLEIPEFTLCEPTTILITLNWYP